MQGFLVKLKDDVFKGMHPNGIDAGYSTIGEVFQRPIVGESCIIGNLRTSMVTSIVNSDDTKIIFKTINSIYVLYPLSIESMIIFIQKSNNYDKLNNMVGAFYDEDHEDYDDEIGLDGIGEAVATELGYL